MKDQLKSKSGTRAVAWMLLIIFCTGLFNPAFAVAIAPSLGTSTISKGHTPKSVNDVEEIDSSDKKNLNLNVKGAGGPTQPEVQSFTPVGVTEMVDPFTGNFSYNIPLMDVEGYPINIAYNSGITMDQEASWVGLGWNLNTGAIVRNMRGLPDDFNGDSITQVEYRKPQSELSVGLAVDWEILGKTRVKTENGAEVADLDTAVADFPQLSAGVNVSYNNYNGFNTQLDFGPSFALLRQNDVPVVSANLMASMSSENGAGFTGGINFHKDIKDANTNADRFTTSISSGYNSRAGLSYLSYGTALTDQMGSKNKNYDYINQSYNLGLQSYTPFSLPSYLTRSITGRVTYTTTLFGVDYQFKGTLCYNRQQIDPSSITKENASYGYFNLEAGQTNTTALLDFNRDNEAAFTKFSPNLPSSFLTNDYFSIQAQGISGSYRAFRNEVGYVFDPEVNSKSGSANLGFEFGLGNSVDFGADITGNVVNSYSGPWTGTLNKAKKEIVFEQLGGLSEEFAFQEAGERAVDTDGLFSTDFNGSNAEHFRLNGVDVLPILTKQLDNGAVDNNNRSERLKRNQLIYFLTIKDVENGLGLFAPRSDIYAEAKDHHIGEITQLGMDGRRYVFGIPAYNIKQEDVTFAIGNTIKDEDGLQPVDDDYSGIVYMGNKFESAADYTKNKYGLDNYYSSKTTPAYAHSFMLTAVLSDDYVDADNVKGPSENDFGSYVKFDYEKVPYVKWRSPMPKNSGFYNEGLKSDETDDKASFIYGEKELWYVDVVETKNFIAVFELDDRKDGLSAADRNGGLDPSGGQTKCLKKISLYARHDYLENGTNAVPIQEVHFVYDYSLCQNYPGHINNGGKLTLKEIYFTYQGSYKLKRSSYKFEYNSPNASYNMKAADRWGNYQPIGSGELDFLDPGSQLNSSDFPYTIQDKETADENAMQWTLSDIHLPSGGKLHIDYESDDYAFVQHLQASQMYPIVATGDQNGDMNAVDPDEPEIQNISRKDETNTNRAIFFKLKPGYTELKDYVSTDSMVYFKCLVNMMDATASTNKYEMISGFGKVVSFSVAGDYGKIQFRSEKLMDNGLASYSPITKAAIVYGRTNLSRTISDVNGVQSPEADENSFMAFANSVANSVASFGEYFTGPNLAIYNKGRCQEIISQHSFIRLLEPTGHKYGGGVRVKAIKMFDNWAKMVNSDSPDARNNYTYGQEFTYQLENGRSSGVASYEPLVGGDENSWRKNKSYNDEIKFAPDKVNFLTDPIMESQFPSPSVGYSRVVIKDLGRDDVTRTATGKVVKEFYTAKDFPTLTSKTAIVKDNGSNSLKVATSFLPLLPKYDYLTASQGFTIELNDMHGKPKSEAVYAEGQDRPLSTVNYNYKRTAYTDQGISCFKLDNTVDVINTNGTTDEAEIGVKYEAVADFRESTTKSFGVGPIDLNNNAFLAGPWYLVIPTVWSKIDKSTSRFRGATLNKTVNRFAILESITANKDGSIVETKNLAYDAETGEALLTETTTNFNDKVYSLKFPAHWKYDGLGQAYKNIGYSVEDVDVFADGFTPMPGAMNKFVIGDEVKVENGSGVELGWVTQVTGNGIRLLDNVGNPLNVSSAKITIIRSGRRNQQSASIATIKALDNPTSGLTSTVYSNVLSAGVAEFSENWKTYCECIPTGSKAVNPYTNGTKGNWRPVRSYTYLTNRLQTNYNNNTNIKKDGVYTSFTPYFFYHNNEWRIDPSNWTFVSEVTNYSPNGMVLETKDALGRYASSLFSFNNTLTTAVASNAKQQQISEGSFEDLNYNNCMNTGVFSDVYNEDIETTSYHTGSASLSVAGGTSKSYTTREAECESSTDCEITVTPLSANTYSVTGATGSPQLTTISGPSYGSMVYSSGVLTVTITGTGYFEGEATFVSSSGCKMKIRINTVLPGNTQLSMHVLSISQN